MRGKTLEVHLKYKGKDEMEYVPFFFLAHLSGVYQARYYIQRDQKRATRARSE